MRPATWDPTTPFRWQDGDRLIVYGRGTAADAPGLVGDGYALLTTERALGQLPALADGATAVHQVPAGPVDAIAADLRNAVEGEHLVALGGGRVIDVAKALAAADPPRRVSAIPTTLSAAEMTPFHRHATGVPAETPFARPRLVVNDPTLCASQPPQDLAASALNSLGHAVEAPLTIFANPASLTVAIEATAHLVGAFGAGTAEPNRDALALGALLSGYAIGFTGLGIHHVMAQTAVRYAGTGHGPANAVLLPHTVRALEHRSPERIAALEEAAGGPLSSIARRIAALAGATRLRELGVERDALPILADEAAARPQLHLTPPAADRDELLAIYESAW
jgi:alcohol dehydrogenase class IV